MGKPTVKIRCLYDGQEELQKILMDSFRLYVFRILAQKPNEAVR